VIYDVDVSVVDAVTPPPPSIDYRPLLREILSDIDALGAKIRAVNP
jgi:hypothetical protein